MAQEFVIKSQNLEDKINQLLPSQGGAAAGVDLSASTMVVPIIDLTESAEGSSLRQDLQTSFSFTQCTSFAVNNATTTLVNTTGYYRVFGTCFVYMNNAQDCQIIINDGTTDKIIFNFDGTVTSTLVNINTASFDFIVKLEAGHSLIAKASTTTHINGNTRQIATITGDLVNP